MNKKINDLKAKILKAQESFDIASLYVMEQEVSELFDEEMLSGFYANILDLALERLTDTLESHKKLDLSEVQDFATARALYEYAIENYSAKQLSDASALFEELSGLTNDEKFSKALKFHWIASAQKIEFEDFLDTIADIEATQKAKTFYISCFNKRADELEVGKA